MEECIFCKIIKKEAPADIVYEDKDLVVFKDIHPKAPIHLLIVPKKHIESVKELSEDDKELVGKMILVSKKLIKVFPEAEEGYRLVFNVGRGGGQIIEHLHLHFLAGHPSSLP